MQLKLGAHTFDVVFEEKPSTDGEEIAYGFIDVGKKEIHICSECDPINTFIFMWHELTHAIFHRLGLIEKEHDEALVHGIAEGIAELLVRNPSIRTPGAFKKARGE